MTVALIGTLPRTNLLCMKNAGTQWIRQTVRQTVRQTDRQTDRQTHLTILNRVV